MWRAIPQGPGLRWRHPGIFQTSCASAAPIGPLADWADNAPTPLQPLQLAPAAVMVYTPCYGNISHSHSHTLPSFSHTHILTAVAAVIRAICPPSPHHRQYLPSPALPICLLPPQRRPKATLSTHELLMGPHMRLSSRRHFLSGIVYVRNRCVFCRLACLCLSCPTCAPSSPSPSYTPR